MLTYLSAHCINRYMKIINEVLLESTKQEVADAQQHLENAIKYDNSPAGGPSSRDAVHRAREHLKVKTKELDRNSGKVKTVKFEVPASKTSDIHMHLHSMWKNKGIPHPLPWGTFHHDDKDKSVVAFHDYTPGAVSGNEGGSTVEDLIKYVKSQAIK